MNLERSRWHDRLRRQVRTVYGFVSIASLGVIIAGYAGVMDWGDVLLVIATCHLVAGLYYFLGWLFFRARSACGRDLSERASQDEGAVATGRWLGWSVVVVGLVAVVLLGMALLRSHQVDQRVVTDGLRVEAEVTDRRVAGGQGSRVNVVSYRVGGEQYSGTYRCQDCEGVGEVLHIYVDARNPRRFVTETGTTSDSWTSWAWAFLIVGAAAVAVGAARPAVVSVRDRYQRKGSGQEEERG